MRTRIWRVGGAIGVASLLALACSGNSKKEDGGTTSETVCDANARRCDGLNVKVCSADGTVETIEETCSPAQSCSDGECRATSCVPNTKFCKSGAIWKCDGKGAGSALFQQCAAGLFCREEDDDASCSTQACTANEPLCDDNVATTCQIDGSGPKPGGTDCSATKQTCYEGICRDIACTSGMKVCQHDDVYLCSQNGADISLFADCVEDEVCDGEMGACRPKICEPGQSKCDGSRATTCNDFGSAYVAEGIDCAASSKVCVGGSCLPQVCVPNAGFCRDGRVYQCDGTGTGSSVTTTCDKRWQHCESFGTYASCVANSCQAGEVVCSDNSIKTCNDDGSLPNTGTACGNDKYCDEGECKPRTCTPERLFCQGGDIYYCYAQAAPQLSQACELESACKATADGATCEPLPCSPSNPVCLGNKVGTCSADGQTLAKVTEDCSPANVCTVDLKCAKTATDGLGDPTGANGEIVSFGTFVGDVVEITSARKLTELQLQLGLAAPRELRWVVFERTNNVFTARYDKVVSSVNGTGFQSSGPLSYSLKAGKRYLLGVVVTGGDATAYFDTAPFSLGVSFGKLVGRVNSYYQSTIDLGNLQGEYAYTMKVVTEAP